MYFLIGKLFAIAFLIFSIGILFTHKGRKFLAEIFSETLLSDILNGNFEDSDDSNIIEYIAVGSFVVLTLLLYVLICVLGALSITVIYPLLIFSIIAGLIIKKKVYKNK